jgi:hypothetical protein
MPPTPPTARGRGEGVAATPTQLLQTRLTQVARKVTGLNGDPRVAPLKAECLALGPLVADAGSAPAAAERLTALEGRVAALEPVLLREEAARSAAVERSAAATRAVDAFKTGAVVTQAVTEQSRAMQKAIAGELTTLQTNKEAIKLRGVVFDSSDKDYHRDVTTPVTALLAKIAPAVADPKLATLAMVDELEAVRIALDRPRLHYSDTEGITDPAKLAQRAKKTSAIASHQEQLKEMGKQMKALLKARVAPVCDALAALSALSADAPRDLEAPAANVGAVLAADAETRAIVFANADAASADGLAAALNRSGKSKELVQELIAARGTDVAFLEGVATTAIRQEVDLKVKTGADQADLKGSFFRNQTVGVIMPQQLVAATREGKAFQKGTKDRLFARLKSGEADCEMDPAKVKGTPEAQAVALARAKAANLAAVRGLVTDVAAQAAAVPDVVARMVDEYYQQALRVSGGDEEYATTQAGGFFMLRMVNPMISADFVTDNAETIKNGTPEEKARLAKQVRGATLQSKVLMNMSNNVEFGAKEPYMADMNELIKTPDGQPAPEMVQLRTALKGVAKRGAASKLPPPALTAVLNSPAAVAAFRPACQRQHAEENLDFYLAARDNPSGEAAQTVFDTYIAEDSPRAINVGGPELAAFKAINSDPKKPWGTAPWAGALKAILSNLGDVLKNASAEMTSINLALMG